jgi:hypothetical protein
MKKNERAVINNIDRELRAQNLVESAGETDESLTGRLGRVVTLFAMTRPLLYALATLPILPTMSRSALTVLLRSLDALTFLAGQGDVGEVTDFKAGRDL